MYPMYPYQQQYPMYPRQMLGQGVPMASDALLPLPPVQYASYQQESGHTQTWTGQHSPFGGQGFRAGDPIGQAEQAQGHTRIKGIYPPETAARICQIAVEAVKNPRVPQMARELVRHIIDENADPFLAVLSEIQAVYNVIQSRMRYTRDPFGVELVYGADFVAKQWEEGQPWADDCDTYAVMLMSFFLSIGRDCRVTIVSFDPHEPERFEHVFVEVLLPPSPQQKIPERWVVVDPSTAGKVRQMTREVKYMRHFYPE